MYQSETYICWYLRVATVAKMFTANITQATTTSDVEPERQLGVLEALVLPSGERHHRAEDDDAPRATSWRGRASRSTASRRTGAARGRSRAPCRRRAASRTACRSCGPGAGGRRSATTTEPSRVGNWSLAAMIRAIEPRDHEEQRGDHQEAEGAPVLVAGLAAWGGCGERGAHVFTSSVGGLAAGHAWRPSRPEPVEAQDVVDEVADGLVVEGEVEAGGGHGRALHAVLDALVQPRVASATPRTGVLRRLRGRGTMSAAFGPVAVGLLAVAAPAAVQEDGLAAGDALRGVGDRVGRRAPCGRSAASAGPAFEKVVEHVVRRAPRRPRSPSTRPQGAMLVPGHAVLDARRPGARASCVLMKAAFVRSRGCGSR